MSNFTPHLTFRTNVKNSSQWIATTLLLKFIKNPSIILGAAIEKQLSSQQYEGKILKFVTYFKLNIQISLDNLKIGIAFEIRILR